MFMFNLAYNFMLGLLAIPMAIAIIVIGIMAIVKVVRLVSIKADIRELELIQAKKEMASKKEEE